MGLCFWDILIQPTLSLDNIFWVYLVATLSFDLESKKSWTWLLLVEARSCSNFYIFDIRWKWDIIQYNKRDQLLYFLFTISQNTVDWSSVLFLFLIWFSNFYFARFSPFELKLAPNCILFKEGWLNWKTWD